MVVEPADDVSIGRPIWRTPVYVLDAHLRLVRDGGSGELYIGGFGVGRGYLQVPTQTAARFMPDPYGPPGTRMYRTGDLVRRQSDGRLICLGRSDAQVKLRGYRIEPGEVEAALRQEPDIHEAVVVARADASGELRLVGYVVGARGAAIDPQALREALGRRLPAYMVPGAIVVLGALPLTANGKIDRRALPAPGLAASPADTAAPRTADEAVLCALMADVLGQTHVGIDDDFFARGGDSLFAARFVRQVRRSVRGAAVSLTDLIARPTVRQLLHGPVREGPMSREASGRRVRPVVPADLPAIRRICTITSDQYRRGDVFEAEHVVPLLWAEPWVLVPGGAGFVVEEHGRILGYIVGAVDLPRVHAACARYVRRRAPALLRAYLGALLRGRVRWPRERHQRFLRLVFGCWGVGPGAAQIRQLWRRLFADAHYDDRFRDGCHVQVDPEADGQGVAVLLLRAWIDAVRASGGPGVAVRPAGFARRDGAREGRAPDDSSAIFVELGLAPARDGWWVLDFSGGRS